MLFKYISDDEDIRRERVVYISKSLWHFRDILVSTVTSINQMFFVRFKED